MTPYEAVQQSVTEQLKLEAGQPGHSYMIVSPDTVTTELCAQIFISLLTGVSDVTALKDVYTLPFGDKVLISDADFITETAYIMPSGLSKKYFIVKSAETANESAQNKLLKTLEEPPETAVIILLCANEYAMLPTVRSRCRIIRPKAYSDDVLRSVLETEYPSCPNPSFAVAVSSGSLSRLKAAVEGGTESFDRALKMLMCMRKSSEILQFATELIARKEKLTEFLDALELILRDCMVIAYRPELIKLKDNVMDIRELSASFSPNAVLKEMPILMRARKRINAGGNVNSIVDELLFSLLEEKAKCQK
ncbi:MAG: hypothetical protein J1F36_04640 [Clostridiales bacterium]|nr:hypothetical protein [Clostridiales bacterium]